MAKIIHYRNKCIGCAICFEQQPELWRMSKKDGKATLLKALLKNQVHQVTIHPSQIELSVRIAEACPVKIIKVNWSESNYLILLFFKQGLNWSNKVVPVVLLSIFDGIDASIA